MYKDRRTDEFKTMEKDPPRIDSTVGKWRFKPKSSQVSSDSVSITTEPETDMWQRSYYGFRVNNSPALLTESEENFTFTTKVSFSYQAQFDQCGLIIYLDDENWCKASIEYENEKFSRLGSVVTNFGYSDWATSDIPLREQIWYRLSRRGPDFLIESSVNSLAFEQMRIFHLHKLGETTPEMGKRNPPLPAHGAVSVGVYACSPLQSSFTAKFTELRFEECKWLAHTV